MTVETMIYAYIAVCVCMIAFNCVYVFIIRHQTIKLEKTSLEYDVLIWEQLKNIEEGCEVDKKHIKLMQKKLMRTSNLTAYDKSLERIHTQAPELTKKYIFEIHQVFVHLALEYADKDEIRAAYLPYIISKYDVLKDMEFDIITDFMFSLIKSKSLYCRENALAAIYTTCNCDYAAKALKAIDSNPYFHHPKLICDGLLRFGGDKNELCSLLWDNMKNFSVNMQLNILNYFRFANVRCDEQIYNMMTDENANRELRFSCIRYFEKFPCEMAKASIQDFAKNTQNRMWEYQMIATSALKSYPCDETEEILKINLSHPNWHIRQNSAISCKKLNYTYSDMIQIFEGNDRYAKEMLRYFFDQKKAENEVKKAT